MKCVVRPDLCNPLSSVCLFVCLLFVVLGWELGVLGLCVLTAQNPFFFGPGSSR